MSLDSERGRIPRSLSVGAQAGGVAQESRVRISGRRGCCSRIVLRILRFAQEWLVASGADFRRVMMARHE
jgi:hypothetical protein